MTENERARNAKKCPENMNAYQNQAVYSIQQIILDHLNQDCDRENAITEAAREIVAGVMDDGEAKRKLIEGLNDIEEMFSSSRVDYMSAVENCQRIIDNLIH